MHSRSATILLFAVGMIALVTVLAFGFLKAMGLQRNAGHAATIALLARESARMGAEQAFEQIVLDFTQQPVTTIDGPARAPFRSHFRPFRLEDGEEQDIRVRDLNNLGAENSLAQPAWTDYFKEGYGRAGNSQMGPTPQSTMLDHRARWIEPRLYASFSTPVSVTGGGRTILLPTAPVRFGDSDGEDIDSPTGWLDGLLTQVGVSTDRNNPNTSHATFNSEAVLLDPASGSTCSPLLFDRNFVRLPYSSRSEAIALRSKARYRLRYAVQVRDLDGYLLINPDPAIDYAKLVSPDPRDAVYAGDPGHARIARYAHAVQNIGLGMTYFGAGTTGVAAGSQDTFGQRLQHVFMGRGWSSNYDRNSDTDPWPRTFPHMYRCVDNETFRYRDLQWWHKNALPNPMPFIAQNLMKGPPGGGEPLSPNPWNKSRHAQTGPQFSPSVAAYVVSGGEGQQDQGANPGLGDSRAQQHNLMIFGRGMSGSGSGRYGGAVGTPWSVNILTAPPENVSALVLGYLPPGVMQIEYKVKAAKYFLPPESGAAPSPPDPGSIDYWGSIRGINDLFVRSHAAAFDRYAPPTRIAPAIAPDYNQRCVLPGEAGYRYPQERYPGPLCFNGADPLTGKAVHDDYGASINLSEQVDRTGRDNLEAAWAPDPHMRQGTGKNDFTFAGPVHLETWPGVYGGVAADPPSDTTPPVTAPWYVVPPVPPFADPNNPPDRNYWQRDQHDYNNWKVASPHVDSFWSDLLYAFNEAVSVARLSKMRFQGNGNQPQVGDSIDGVPRNDPAIDCNSIADLDRLFLRCLGLNLGNLATVAAERLAAAPMANTGWVKGWNNNWTRYTVPQNLFTLSTTLPDRTVKIYGLTAGRADKAAAGATDNVCNAKMQTQVLELIVNDFRYSFFGSIPSYSASFRPIDFNGDGAVAFSGYRPGRYAYVDTGATDTAVLRTLMQIDQDCPADASGCGDWPTPHAATGEVGAAEFATASIDPFCITGNFWIGRSRFWSVLVRGQVFDNQFKRPISQADLETWLVVDPALRSEAGQAQQQYTTHILWQRWNFNLYKGLMLRDF